MNDTHPHGVHNDAEGPLLFVGGHCDGEFRTVNRSRDSWIVPEYGPEDEEKANVRNAVYLKRRFHLGGPTGPIVTVMVREGVSPSRAEHLLLARIAQGLAEGKW